MNMSKYLRRDPMGHGGLKVIRHLCLFAQCSIDVESALWSIGQRGFLSDFEKMVY